MFFLGMGGYLFRLTEIGSSMSALLLIFFSEDMLKVELLARPVEGWIYEACSVPKVSVNKR